MSSSDNRNSPHDSRILNPYAMAYCRASREFCTLFRRAVYVCVIVSSLSFLSANINTVSVCLTVSTVVVGILVILLLLHVCVVGLFFARYTLGDLLKATLVLATLLTAVSLIPSEFTLLPLAALVGFISKIIMYICWQNPTGENTTPKFIVEAKADYEQRKTRAP